MENIALGVLLFIAIFSLECLLFFPLSEEVALETLDVSPHGSAEPHPFDSAVKKMLDEVFSEPQVDKQSDETLVGECPFSPP